MWEMFGEKYQEFMASPKLLPSNSDVGHQLSGPQFSHMYKRCLTSPVYHLTVSVKTKHSSVGP